MSRSIRWPSLPPAVLGPALVAILALGYAYLWVICAPGQMPLARFIAELAGAEALFLFSVCLVLASRLGPVETIFDGYDRALLWHRNFAIIGMSLVALHVPLVGDLPTAAGRGGGQPPGWIALLGIAFLSLWAVAPRIHQRWPGRLKRLAEMPYERWLGAHRLMGVFFAFAILHSALVDRSLFDTPALRVAYLLIALVGVGAYLYRELLVRFVTPSVEYTVSDVSRPGNDTLVVGLAPLRRRLAFRAGQFVFVEIRGHRGSHPFSVSSSPSDDRLELSIRALGDYTTRLHASLSPGARARITGPFGRFDYRSGRPRQVWIASGIGITPFLSWLRSPSTELPTAVDLYYAVPMERTALAAAEIRKLATDWAGLHLHVVESSVDGRLTIDRVAQEIPDLAERSIFMCGPSTMMGAFERALRSLGVRGSQIRWERFDIR